ncbi:acyltransferase family protein [Aliarcobacter butzleri]|uniref:acyltransferase family protein n=1 Tax=Aliarcobacter butzleri TaxID=28197 RepID=UPI002B244AFC|nr:acyltransferase [Aliarcobacter butzleri]
MSTKQKQQYLLLQVLRAYAAFLVIYEHLFGSFIDLIQKDSNIYSKFISNYIFSPLGIADQGGGLGVVQFFILSGFVITMVGLRETRFEFAVKRFLRILPPIFFALTIIATLYWILYFFNMTSFIDMHSSQWPSLVSWNDFNLISFLKNLFLVNVNMNMVMWTLRIEIIFYILIFLCLPIIKKKPIKFYVIISLIYIIAYVLDITSKYYFGSYGELYGKIYGQFEYVIFLFLGSLFYLWYDNKINSTSFIILSGNFFILIWDNELSRYIFLSYILIVFSIYFNNKIQVNKLLQYFGNISYSTYLNHQTIGTILMSIFISKFGYSSNNFLFFFITILLLILFISSVSFKYIEQPSQQFARKIIKKVQGEK